MATFFLITSAFLFILTYLFHGAHIRGDRWVPYMSKHWYTFIIILCGHVFPVIPITIVSGLHWLAIFLINSSFLLIFSRFLSKGVLYLCDDRFPNPWELFNDYRLSSIVGIIALVIGLLI